MYGRSHPGGRLFWGGLKAFADGSLGSRTALMWEPYSDAEAVHGPQDGATSRGGDVEGGAETAEGEGCDAEGALGGPSRCGQRAIGRQELIELTSLAVRAGMQVRVTPGKGSGGAVQKINKWGEGMLTGSPMTVRYLCAVPTASTTKTARAKVAAVGLSSSRVEPIRTPM